MGRIREGLSQAETLDANRRVLGVLLHINIFPRTQCKKYLFILLVATSS